MSKIRNIRSAELMVPAKTHLDLLRVIKAISTFSIGGESQPPPTEEV